ncbi:response regulator transcription factor [Ewingella americana]|uniref:response regulator transcription factor n=1 Tax=Ewingella americana TaxID=41202 RepID=UPI001639EF2C|nr:response regulator transcription factor [Ewingella americana]QMV52633.1 response regulator transcription factor [Ewingella americana]
MNKRVLLVDNHPLVRFGLRSFLLEHGFNIIGEAEDGAQALLMAEELKPHWVILDVALPKLNGLQVIYHLLAADRPMNVIVFTGQELKHYVNACIQAGACGFVRKTAPLESLMCAMESAAMGHVWLPASRVYGGKAEHGRSHGLTHRVSDCERKVMSLLLQGKSNNEISQILNRSPKTTSAQKKSVLQKLNVSSIAELISVTTINRRMNPL